MSYAEGVFMTGGVPDRAAWALVGSPKPRERQTNKEAR